MQIRGLHSVRVRSIILVQKFHSNVLTQWGQKLSKVKLSFINVVKYLIHDNYSKSFNLQIREIADGGFISECFSDGLKYSKKKVPNHSLEHYPPKEKMLRKVIWHLFWEI